jgi:cytochrome c-type biogenesis protein
MDLTIAVALGAGLLSFLSPCVLPLVPAYIGQLSAVAVVGRAEGQPSRWLAVRHAIAYVIGFGAVFTILGITATYAAGPLFDYLPILRQAGGILLIVLGLNLAGVLRIPALDRTFRPLEAGAAASVASATGTVALAAPGGSGGIGAGRATGARFADRLGGRIVGARGGWVA